MDERVLPATAPLRESLQRVDDDIAALVAAFVNGMAAVIARHPWLPPLWVREVLCDPILASPEGAALAAGAIDSGAARDLLARWIAFR